MISLLALLPQTGPASHGLGVEWLPIASVVLPFLVFLLILHMGRKRV